MTDRAQEIVRLVIERTEKGTLDWKLAAKDQGAFSVRVGSTTVTIRRQAIDFSMVVRLEVYDDQGNRIETIGGAEWQRPLSDLFTRVKRKALRVDESLDALISDLKSD